MLATRQARLFTKAEPQRGALATYACSYIRDKRFLLSRQETEPGGSGDLVRLPMLAGSYVAYALAHFDDSQRYNQSFEGFPDQVVAINLSTGAELRFKAVASNFPAAKVSDLVLSKSGSAAWIASDGSGNEVHRFDVGDSADTVVASGPDVQAGSLALAGTTIYWTAAGRPASAPIR